MKNSLMLLILIGCTTAALAQDDQSWKARGWFVGASVGIAELDEKIFDDDVIFDKEDDRDMVIEVLGGYQFSRYFGMEVGFLDLGTMEIAEDNNTVSFDIDGFKYMLYGRIPAGKRFAFLGKIGAFHNNMTRTFNIQGAGEREKDTNASVALEASFHYRITPNLNLTFDLSHYDLEWLNFDLDFGHNDEEWWHDLEGINRNVQMGRVGVRYRF